MDATDASITSGSVFAVLAIIAFPLRWISAPGAEPMRRKNAPSNNAARLWLFAAPALLGPAVVFVLGPHTIFANNAAEFAVGVQRARGAVAAANGRAQLDHPARHRLRHSRCLSEQADADVRSDSCSRLALLLWGQGNLWNADYGVLAGQDLDLSVHAWRAPYQLAAGPAMLFLALVCFRPVSRIAPFSPRSCSWPFNWPRSLLSDGIRRRAARELDRTATLDLPVLPGSERHSHRARRIPVGCVQRHFSAGSSVAQSPSSAVFSISPSMRFVSDDLVQHAGNAGGPGIPEREAGAGIHSRSVQALVRVRKSVECWIRRRRDVDRTDRFIRAVAGSGSGANWKGASFRIRKPFVSRDDYREVSARQLLELSLFRHVPHAAKAISVDRPDSFYWPIAIDRTESPTQVRRHEASNSVAFLERFIDLMSATTRSPCLRALHVGVRTAPSSSIVNAASSALTGMSKESYTEQSRCAIKLVAALLDRVRALGIYDSSLIIVSSDHGTNFQPAGFSWTERKPLAYSRAVHRTAAGRPSTARAVMLIKPSRRTGPVTISDAPTSHVDVPRRSSTSSASRALRRIG